MRSLSTLLLAGLATVGLADIHIQPVRPSYGYEGEYTQSVSSGDQIHVHWFSDTNYTVDLKLVQHRSHGWYPVEDLFSGRVYAPGNYTYLWTVPSVLERYNYGLWIYGTTNSTTNSTSDSSDASTEPLDSDNTFNGDAAVEPMSNGTFALNAGNSTSNVSVTDLTPWFGIYAYTSVVYRHHSWQSGPAIAGIAVGSSAVFLAAIAGLIWLFLRRRRAKKAKAWTVKAVHRPFENEPMARQQSYEHARPPVYAMSPVESRPRQPSKHVMSMSTMGASTMAPLSGEYRSSMETLDFEKDQAKSTSKYAGT